MSYFKLGVAAGALIALMMGVSGAAMAGSDEEQLKRMADPDQWPAPGRDFSLTRHSTSVSDITTEKRQQAPDDLARRAPTSSAAMRVSP